MTTIDLPAGDLDLAAGYRSSGDCTCETEGSQCFSDAEEGSTCSQFHSTNGDSFDDYSYSLTGGDQFRRNSSATASECSVEMEMEMEETSRVHLDREDSEERDCRICHMSLNSVNYESGVPIELGCSCKHDLAVAHKHCAESWFKIKGNRICEICKTTAENVAGPNEVESTREPANEHSSAVVMVVVEPSPPAPLPLRTPEPRRFWNAHRFLNFLLACMVFAFVISWLFRFNAPS